MTATEPEGPTALTNVGPRPEAGDPGTPEFQAVLAVLRENGVQTNADDTGTLATKIVNAVRSVTPAAEEAEGEAEAVE